LADLYAPIRPDLEQIQGLIRSELASRHSFVDELSRRVQRYHGKMLRPALLLLTGRACGSTTEAHRVLAAVVELVHLATLVHDDVLDDAAMRRGHDTINAANGNKTAVLLGDYLISHAYHLCSSLDDQHAALTVAATTNLVCEGELAQVARRRDPTLTESEYFDIIRKKTAALTATCCALGAHYAGAPEDVVYAAGQFGTAAGCAFQIVDDLLDLTGYEEETGKSTGRDLAFGTATLPVIHCLSAADPDVRRALSAMVAGEAPTCLRSVRDWLGDCGSIRMAREKARSFVDQALAHLETLPASPARDSLSAMTEFILRRDF